MMIIIGFSSSGGSTVAVTAPMIDAANDSGKSLPTTLKSTFPDRMKEIVEVSEPNELASLLVPSAVAGCIPTASNAGVEISPPPPTTASINAARNPKKIIINNI
jgi:hypothetical protein